MGAVPQVSRPSGASKRPLGAELVNSSGALSCAIILKSSRVTPGGWAISRAQHDKVDDLQLSASSNSSLGFPAASPALETFGLKFSPGGAHISRTMMLAELGVVLDNVPKGSGGAEYRDAILQRNLLGKNTDSTRQKSLRHLRELYALDEATPIFGLLRKLHWVDAGSLPLLAVQVAWARDPLLRATTPAIMGASDGERVETASLAKALEGAFPISIRN